MTSETVMSLHGVSKKFCRNLRRSMRYGLQELTLDMFGVHTRTDQLRKYEFWALDGIDLELRRGEILGLIGPNGGGKSTLLRLMAGIYLPDKGQVACNGRLSALIALGAGFHPHMSGRENIRLNGAILGMSGSEIDTVFDDIVTFAELEEFIDSPLATYSSGMWVRLGVSVAIHARPDVLLVDEVLAVGDAAFRSRAYEKIQAMREHCAVVLVSHNMDYIKKYATHALVVAKGQGSPFDDVDEAVASYLNGAS